MSDIFAKAIELKKELLKDDNILSASESQKIDDIVEISKELSTAEKKKLMDKLFNVNQLKFIVNFPA